MKKLRLEIDELRVESFPTTPGRDAARGTVRGRAWECTMEPCTDALDCTAHDCTTSCGPDVQDPSTAVSGGVAPTGVFVPTCNKTCYTCSCNG